MGGELTRAAGGGLLIPEDQLGALKDVDPKNLRISRLHEDLLLSAHAQPGERLKPLMYGDLRLFHVGELVALISSMRKNGTLHLMIPHAKKSVYFSEGEIIYASSTVEDDRLGEVLWRRGFLSLEQLSEVHDLVTPSKKLGAVLVEKGLISPRQVYEGIKEQILEIVYSTFHIRKGEFVFIEGRVRIRGPVRLDMGTREVMMEGVRRVEEMTKLEELFPQRDLPLVRKMALAQTELGERERRLHDLTDGRRTVKEVVDDSHLGEFDALRALAKLRRLGLIDVSGQSEETRQVDVPLPEAMEDYVRPLRFIHQTLLAEAPGSQARLEAYLGSPSPRHQEIFRNVGFDADGRLDMETLHRNARQQAPDRFRELAMEAIRGLYDYAVFQAMDVLDDDACDRMMTRLQKMRSGEDGREAS